MAMTDAAVTHVAKTLIGEAVTAFNNANAYIGVGDSTDAFDATDTDLQAPTNVFRKAMEPGYPSRSGDILTFRSLFSTSQANFDWEEWAVFNASSSGTMLNRKVETIGTKTSAESWQLTVDITVNNP